VEDTLASMVDVAGALSLISNKSGRRISASADEAPKDSYMGYLLLRHLRIRDLRAKVSRWVWSVAGVKCEHAICMSCQGRWEWSQKQSGLRCGLKGECGVEKFRSK